MTSCTINQECFVAEQQQRFDDSGIRYTGSGLLALRHNKAYIKPGVPPDSQLSPLARYAAQSAMSRRRRSNRSVRR